MSNPDYPCQKCGAPTVNDALPSDVSLRCPECGWRPVVTQDVSGAIGAWAELAAKCEALQERVDQAEAMLKNTALDDAIRELAGLTAENERLKETTDKMADAFTRRAEAEVIMLAELETEVRAEMLQKVKSVFLSLQNLHPDVERLLRTVEASILAALEADSKGESNE